MNPYANVKFRLLWQGQPVAAFSKVSPLRRAQETASFREGGGPSGVRVLPGQTSFDPITLERGLTLDAGFQTWTSQVWNFTANDQTPTSLADFRRDLRLDFYNEANQLVWAYDLLSCWPSEYVAMPELDASANAVAIQTLVLQNEGRSRRTDVVPPPAPTY